ncbi:MAG: TonB-dependent receptor [Gemmatimonadales bacterium]
MLRRVWCAIGLVVVSANRAEGQAIRVRAVEAETDRPVAGAIVSALDSTGRPWARGLTDERGRLVLHPPNPGVYRLRADRLGHEGTTTEPFALTDTISLTVVMPLGRVRLSEVVATAETSCHQGGRPVGDLDLARVWSEARKGLLSSEITAEDKELRLVVRKFRRRRTLGGALRSDSTLATYLTAPPAFVSEDPGSLLALGFIQAEDGRYRFLAPDAAALLSEEFLLVHCLSAVSAGAERPGLVGVAFEPDGERRVPDVRGVVWLDRDSAWVREIDFAYQGAPGAVRFPGIGGRLSFLRLRGGRVVVGDWHVRLPDRVRVAGLDGATRDTIVGYLEEGGTARLAGNAALHLEGYAPRVVATTTELLDLRLRVLTPDSLPIRGARLALGGIDTALVTDGEGRVMVTTALRGVLRFRATAVGFQPVVAAIDLSHRARELDTVLVLAPYAQRLAPLEVTGAAPRSPGKLLDFERRRRLGIGSFLDRAALAAWEPLPLSTAMRTIRGVTLVPRAARCGGGFAAGSWRSSRGGACTAMPACFFSVYVDGVRRFDPADGGAPPNVDEFLTERVEAIEVYRGPGETPAEYGGTGDACGALVIWTRITGSPP